MNNYPSKKSQTASNFRSNEGVAAHTPSTSGFVPTNRSRPRQPQHVMSMENQIDKENQLLSSGTQNKVKDTIESYRRTKNMLKDLSKNLKGNPRTKSSRRGVEDGS